MRRFTVPVLLVALTLAACGGGDKKEDVSAKSTTTVKRGKAAGTDFCQKAKSITEEAAALAPNSQDKESIKKAYEFVSQGLVDLAALAPTGLKADVEKMKTTSETFLAELRKVDFDVSKVPAEVQQASSSPEVQQASQHVTTYLQQSCGLTSGGGSQSSTPTSAP